MTESVSAGSFPSPSFEAYECCLLPGTLCRSQKLEVLCNIGCRVAYKGRKTGEEKNEGGPSRENSDNELEPI